MSQDRSASATQGVVTPPSSEHSTTQGSRATPNEIPSDSLIDEERLSTYNSKDYYHPNPDDVLSQQYKLIAKVGWGSSSTVWLAEDTQSQTCSSKNDYVTIKIQNCHFRNTEDADHELNISKLLIGASAEQKGAAIVRTPHSVFEIETPLGSHICLVYEPMREPLWLLRQRMCGNHVTLPFLTIIKIYLNALLEGLDFLHADCHIVHTDLKLDNILVTFEDEVVIDRFVENQKLHPMPRKKIEEGYVYLSHNDFQQLDSVQSLLTIYPKITDFGLAEHLSEHSPRPRFHPIQPDAYQAPEVLLGTGWSYEADVWSFGIMVRLRNSMGKDLAN
jgi:serine/threonine-protein kinase SRPK3